MLFPASRLPRFLTAFLSSLGLWLILSGSPLPASTQSPEVQSASFDNRQRFAVEATIPAGSGHAVLEMLSPAQSGQWKPLIAGTLDGRAAVATFRLPKPPQAPTVLVRVRTGVSAELPAVELTDPALFSVIYPGSGGTVSTQEKLDFLDAAGRKMQEWENLPRVERHTNLTSWAKQNHLVAHAGAEPDANNIFVEYLDGDIAVLLDPRRTGTAAPSRAAAFPRPMTKWPDPNLSSAVHGAPDAPSWNAAAGSLPASVPGSTSAVAAFSLEPTFPNSSPTVANWLRRSGYTAREFPATTVGQIAGWSAAEPLGVLFWHAHGVTFKKKDGSTTAGLVTGEQVTDALDNGAYKAMRDAGEVFMAKDGKLPPVYFITGRFVKKHLQFSPHSLVVVDACYGANSDLAANFIEAGAGGYVSWDWESGPASGTPCLQLFDRLLGTNDEPPLSTPKERSFSLPIVKLWMEMRGFDVDPSVKAPGQVRSNARLVWKAHPATPAHILKPSLMRILHQFSGHEGNFTAFLLEGDFGRDPGPANRKVFWAGQPVSVLSWDQQDGILIRPPVPAPAGNFEVVIRNRFYSNAVPFTRWSVPFVFEYEGPGSLTYKVEMNARIFGDVHGSRGFPEQEVEYLDLPFVSLDGAIGQVSASGSYQPEPDEVVTWSGGTALTSVDAVTVTGPTENKFHFQGTLSPTREQIAQFNLVSTGHFTETTKRGSGQVGAPVLGLTWPPPSLELIFQTSALTGDELSFDFPDGSSAGLSWPTVIPQAAPHDLTVR